MTWFGHRSPRAWLRRFLHGRKRKNVGQPRPIRIVGHRGAPRLFPENTVASYAAALDLGADAIEIDVCLTCDDVLVLWHDNEPSDPVSLARGIGVEEFAFTCDWPQLLSSARKPVYEMTLEEMRAACSYSPKGIHLTDQKGVIGFELLEDLFRWANGEPRLKEIFFDVKLRVKDAARAPLIVDAIRKLRTRDDLACTLLLPQRELYAALAPVELPTHVRIVPDFELANILAGLREVEARWVSTGYTLKRTWGDFTRELAALLDARDAAKLDRVVLWTFNDAERLRYLVASGVDGILTDDPALLTRIIRERSETRDGRG